MNERSPTLRRGLLPVAVLAKHLALRELGLATLTRQRPHAVRYLVLWIAMVDLEALGRTAPTTPAAESDDRLTPASLHPLVLERAEVVATLLRAQCLNVPRSL